VGEFAGIREMRKHVAWYATGFKGASKLRGAVNEVETMEQLKELLKRYRDSLL
jgi:tRNA-dihydrouridine synthase